MGKLRLATGEIKRIDLDGDWIDVHSDLSKRRFNDLMSAMPDREVSVNSGLTPKEGADFTRALFEALVTAWSLEVPATIENYDELTSDAGQIIDAALIEHFGEMAPTDDEQSKAATSRGKRRGA